MTDTAGKTDDQILAEMQDEVTPTPDQPTFAAGPTGDLEGLCNPTHVDEWIKTILWPYIDDAPRERIARASIWCANWRQHPLVSMHVHCAYLGWPGPQDEDPSNAHTAYVYWRNAFLDPLLDLLVRSGRPVFARCEDGHTIPARQFGEPNHDR